MLSVKIVTHKVIVKNQDWKWITKYPLTKEMYTEYSMAKLNRQYWDDIWLKDLDWNNIRRLDPIKFEEWEEIGNKEKEYNLEVKQNLYTEIEWEKIRKMKMKRYNFFKSLSKEKQEEIEAQAWRKVFETTKFKDKNIFAKWIFIMIKNIIINKYIK